MAGYSLSHLIEDFIERLVTNNPTYAPVGPPDFTDEQLVAMTATFTDIATAVHNHILSWYVANDQPFPDELVKSTALDPTSGYLGDKIDNYTLRINPETLKLEVTSVVSGAFGGILIGNNPDSCIYINNNELYVRTQRDLFSSNLDSEVPTVRAVKDYVIEMIADIEGGTGIGDMLKNIYDVDDDGIVDNSERLGNQLPAYYLDYNNFINTPPAVDIYNFYNDLQIHKNELIEAVIQNIAGTPSSPTQGQIYFNTTTKRLMFYDNITWRSCFSDIDDFVNLTEEATIASGDWVVIYDVSVSAYRKMSRSNFISGLGAGIANAYDRITDGTITANAASNDIIRFRADTGLTVSVGSNDPTYGDYVLYGLNLSAFTAVTTLVDADQLPIYISGIGNRKITFANLKSELQIDKFVVGPATTTNGYVPVWNGTSGNALSAGYVVETTLTGSTTAVVRSDAIKTYVDNAIGGNFWQLNSIFLSPINSSYWISLGLSSALSFGDNDTYIYQPSDDVLNIVLSGSAIISIAAGVVGVINAYYFANKSSAGFINYGFHATNNYTYGFYASNNGTGFCYNGLYSGMILDNANGYDTLLLRKNKPLTNHDSTNILSLYNNYTSGTYSINGNLIYINDNSAATVTNSVKAFLVSCGSGGAVVDKIMFWPRIPNGSSAIAYILDTVTNLTISGALLLSLKNAGVQKFSVDKDGNINLAAGANYYVNGVLALFTINNFTNNALITCGASTNVLEAETTLSYNATTHIIYNSYGSATDGISGYRATGSTSAVTGNAMVQLVATNTFDIYTGGAGHVGELIEEGDASATSTIPVANNSFVGTTAGRITLYTRGNSALVLATNDISRLHIDGNGNTGICTCINTLPINTRLTVMDYNKSCEVRVESNSGTVASAGSILSGGRNRDVNDIRSYTSAATSINGDTLFTVRAQGFYWASISDFNYRDAAYIRFVQSGNCGVYCPAEIRFFLTNSNSAQPTEKVRMDTLGNVYAIGQFFGNSGVPSDIRLKYDFGEIENALEKIKNLIGKSFKYSCIYKPDDGDRKHLGFIAQDLENIIPEIVSEHTLINMGETKYKVISYDELIPVIVEAIKELSRNIDKLKDTKSTILK